MARPKTFTEMEQAVEFFPEGSHKLVARLIARATKKEMAANRRALKGAVSGTRDAQRLGQAVSRHVAKQLTKALRQRGATKRQASSVKQKAPDTGGRPFHFAHSAVSKTTAAKDAATAKGAGSGAPGSKPATKSAAHMRYIEREAAFERSPASEVDRSEGMGLPQEGRSARATSGATDVAKPRPPRNAWASPAARVRPTSRTRSSSRTARTWCSPSGR